MSNSKYITVKIDFQNILLIVLLLFSVTMTLYFISQKNDINVLKSQRFIQNISIKNLKNRVSNLEDEKSNLEDKTYDLESRIDDLENR